MNRFAKNFGILLLLILGLAGQPIHAGDFQEDFENGWGSWLVEYSTWEVGTPTSGPEDCYGGDQCAGTVLDGSYSETGSARLVSTSIRLSEVGADDEIMLRFNHWFSFGMYDYGNVQISVYDDTTEEWSDWKRISTSYKQDSSVWTPAGVELTQYAGQKIRIAFYHYAATGWKDDGAGSGWYIDDIDITGVNAAWGVDNFDSARELGRQDCINNPASCGLSPGVVEYPTYSQEGQLHLPRVYYKGDMSQAYEAFLQIVPSSDPVEFIVTGVEAVE